MGTDCGESNRTRELALGLKKIPGITCSNIVDYRTMSGRNLKIRITVGHDSHNLGAANDATNTSTPAPQRTKPSVTQILIAGIASLAVISSAWISLSDRDEPQPKLSSTATIETAKPSETLATAIPQNAPAGAIGAADTSIVASAQIVKPASTKETRNDARSQKQEREPTSEKAQPSAAAGKKAVTAGKAVAQPGRITRAVLTSKVVNREPIDQLAKSVAAPEKPKPLFYFTEIVDMKGATLTHRWRHEGKVVADMKFRIDSDRYRVYSNKLMRPNSKGNWQIEVLDQHGHTLQTAHFTYQ